jgi:hypothetical protein
MKRRFLLRGAYIACGILLCIALVSAVSLGLAYDGTCGGFFPGLSARRSCSFWEYFSGDMLAIAMILGATFWPVVLALLVLPPFVGYWLDRRGKRDAA